MAETEWFKRFLILFFVGFFVILLGIVLLTVAALLSGTGNASVGGFIWVFPFLPIVFGAGPETHWLILLAAVLAILGVFMFFVMWKTLERRVS